MAGRCKNPDQKSIWTFDFFHVWGGGNAFGVEHKRYALTESRFFAVPGHPGWWMYFEAPDLGNLETVHGPLYDAAILWFQMFACWNPDNYLYFAPGTAPWGEGL